jgi:voltage-gated potassium channel Kch
MSKFSEIRHHCLFVSLVALLLLEPVLIGNKRISGLAIVVLISVVFVAAIFAVAPSRRYRVAATILGLASITLRWLSEGWSNSAPWLKGASLVAFSDLVSAVFLGLCAIILLAHVLRSDGMGSESIAAAVSAYLLLGFSWARIYHGLSQLYPKSAFIVGGQPASLDDLSCTYLSFVTLTTIGYGDIVPADPFARRLALVEGLTGVFFLAVIISWVISGLRQGRGER